MRAYSNHNFPNSGKLTITPPFFRHHDLHGFFPISFTCGGNINLLKLLSNNVLDLENQDNEIF
jgi:hypothetical protein